MRPIAEFSYGSLEGYLNANVLVEGLRRAGRIHPESLKVALESLGPLDLGGLSRADRAQAELIFAPRTLGLDRGPMMSGFDAAKG